MALTSNEFELAIASRLDRSCGLATTQQNKALTQPGGPRFQWHCYLTVTCVTAGRVDSFAPSSTQELIRG